MRVSVVNPGTVFVVVETTDVTSWGVLVVVVVPVEVAKLDVSVEVRVVVAIV